MTWACPGGEILLVGASVRAAAFSARRAGLRVWAVDLFADRDLRAVAEGVRRCPPEEYPDGLMARADGWPAVPLAYTGWLEDRPDLIASWSSRRPLLGCAASALARARSPAFVAATLRDAGLPSLEVRDSPAEGFLKKRLGRSHYWQRFRSGVCGSTCFFAGERLECRGHTRQIILDGYRYGGSVGPWEVPSGDVLRRTGRVLYEACGLVGPFGVDWILSDGVPWVTEVNPRYPASWEVLEWAGPRGGAVGKRIVYAEEDFAFPAAGPWDADITDDVWRRPGFADIPEAGERIEAGQPVYTAVTVSPGAGRPDS